MKYVYTGAVVKYPNKDDLYIVVKSDNDSSGNCVKLTLIPFNHSNTSICVSKEHPTMNYDSDGNITTRINENYSIENIEYVSDTVSNYLKQRMKFVFGF